MRINPQPVRGFVHTSAGKYNRAYKYADGTVESEGGKKFLVRVAKTFEERPWNITIEYLEAMFAREAELERLMPRARQSYSHTYVCRMCGLLVGDRNTHLNWHNGAGAFNVLVGLFGEGAANA